MDFSTQDRSRNELAVRQKIVLDNSFAPFHCELPSFIECQFAIVGAIKQWVFLNTFPDIVLVYDNIFSAIYKHLHLKPVKGSLFTVAVQWSWRKMFFHLFDAVFVA